MKRKPKAATAKKQSGPRQGKPRKTDQARPRDSQSKNQPDSVRHFNQESTLAYFKNILKNRQLSKPLVLTLSLFLLASIRLKTLIPTIVGRAMPSTLPRFGTKRAHRLLKNKHLTPETTCAILLELFANLLLKQQKLLLIIDWTFIRSFAFFSISMVLESGRTLPLIFGGYKQGEQTVDQFQPRIEQDCLKLLFGRIPAGMPGLVLADRGFDSPATLQFIESYGYQYIIRASTQENMYTSSGRMKKITKSLVKKRGQKIYSNIEYTTKHRLLTNLYCIWNYDQDEPWLLLSNIKKASVAEIAGEYCKRMTIEEMFRSLKNDRDGFNIKIVRLRHLDRWLRFLFVATLLFHFLGELGILLLKINGIEKYFSLSSSVPKKQRSIFSIYYLAVLVLTNTFLRVRCRANRWQFSLRGSAWIVYV